MENAWYEILVLWMGCLQGYPRGWKIQSDLRGFFGNTFSEMKKCWEGVPLLWKAKVDTYRTFLHNRNYSLTHCRQPVDGWIVQITRFLTKLPVISAKLPVACDEWRHVWTNWSFEIRGSARGFWVSPTFKKWNASFEKRIRLLRKEPRLFDLREDASFAEERFFYFFFL